MRFKSIVYAIQLFALVLPSAADERSAEVLVDEPTSTFVYAELEEHLQPVDLQIDYYLNLKDQCLDEIADDLAHCQETARKSMTPWADRRGKQLYLLAHYGCYTTFQTQSLSCECDFPSNGSPPLFCSNECVLEEMACDSLAEAANIACRADSKPRAECDRRGTAARKSCQTTATPACRHFGCTDVFAENYDRHANIDNGSCIHEKEEMPEETPGCTDVTAINSNPNADVEDDSCLYEEEVMPD